MHLRSLLSLFLMVSALPAALAAGLPRFEKESTVKKALNVLWAESLVAEKYAYGRTDEPTEFAWAFSVIVNESDDPIAKMRLLCRSGSYYGLLGLYVLDRQSYEAEKARFAGDGKVTLVRGDTFEVMSRTEFVSTFIEKQGEKLFRNLVFEETPDWRDTVKLKAIASSSLRSEED
jgi:hypothetical protein